MKKLLLALPLAISVSACVYKPNTQQGNIIEEETISEVRPGMSKNEVNDLLGTPMIQDRFNPHRWDYVYYFRDRDGAEERKRVTIVFEDNRVALISRGDLPQKSAPVAADDPTNSPVKPAGGESLPAATFSTGAIDKAEQTEAGALSIPADGSGAEVIPQPEPLPSANIDNNPIDEPNPVPQIVVPFDGTDETATQTQPEVEAKATPPKPRSSLDIISSDEAEPDVEIPLTENKSSDIIFNPANQPPPPPRPAPAPEPTEVPQQAGQVEVGMSKTDVLQVLGVPPKGAELQGNEWNYTARDGSRKKLKLTFRNGKLAQIERTE